MEGVVSLSTKFVLCTILVVCLTFISVDASAPINITLSNDNHVCPSSRARWQDYTVYLETRPRLCMM